MWKKWFCAFIIIKLNELPTSSKSFDLSGDELYRREWNNQHLKSNPAAIEQEWNSVLDGENEAQKDDHRTKSTYAWRSGPNGRTHLTYALVNFPSRTSLSQEEVKKTFELAISVWTCYSLITFDRVDISDHPDIFVSFETDLHGYYNFFNKEKVTQNCHSFDGVGGKLAHAFMPRSHFAYRTMGNLHFDDEEYWTSGKNSGVNFFYAAVHELGHILGLSHAADLGNVMHRRIRRRVKEATIDLGRSDILEIQRRYGEKTCRRKAWKKYYRSRSIRVKTSLLVYDSYGYPVLPQRKCTDVYAYCSDYHTAVCRHGLYREWMSRKCKRHCGFCAQTLPTRVANTHVCTDRFRLCRRYLRSMCFDPFHRPWMQKNCRKSCGLCD